MLSTKSRKWKTLTFLLVICMLSSVAPSYASQVESFFALSKSQFEKFCEIANLIPESKLPPVNPNAHWEVRAISRKEQQTPEYKKTQAHYKEVWDYLHKNGKRPYEFDWSGYVVFEVMEYLKSTKNIDLMENMLCERDRDFQWWVFDKNTKDKYLKQLDPVNFKEEELRKSFLAEAKRNHENVLSKIAERRDELLKEGKITKEQAKDAFHIEEIVYKDIDFPERGKALMDAVKLIHQFLKLVNDDTVVILHIG